MLVIYDLNLLKWSLTPSVKMHTFSSIEITSSCPKSNNRAPKSANFWQLNSFLFFFLSFLANEWILGPSRGVVLEETCMF